MDTLIAISTTKIGFGLAQVKKTKKKLPFLYKMCSDIVVTTTSYPTPTPTAMPTENIPY